RARDFLAVHDRSLDQLAALLPALAPELDDALSIALLGLPAGRAGSTLQLAVRERADTFAGGGHPSPFQADRPADRRKHPPARLALRAVGIDASGFAKLMSPARALGVHGHTRDRARHLPRLRRTTTP